MAGRIDYESMEENIKIDVKDKRILSLLAENARTPLTAIAKKVQLSRDAVDYRIKRLQKDGVIQRFFASVNYEKLGYYVFHVFYLLDEVNKEQYRQLMEHLKKHPNIISIIEYNDRWDIHVEMIARNLIEFDIILSEIASKYPDTIVEKDKAEIIRSYSNNFVPPLIAGQESIKIVQKQPVPVKVDDTDLKLLRLLCEDCRASTYQLAQQLHISPDTVGYRIQNLLKEEVITKFTIQVNYSKMKYILYTFSIGMKMFDLANEQKFKSFLDKNLNILKSTKTLGGWDLLLYIVVQHPREYHALVKDMKATFTNIIRSYQTWIAYKEYIYEPLPAVIK
ncbi:MAG: Lrp/AsnC family transcriptional regulator [archaeon]